MLTAVTPLVLTYNEAPNIRRTLERLSWANEILVVDSLSTDETLDIVKSFPQVRAIQRKFDSHAAQWNFGIQQVNTPWVLSLDADYILPENFSEELNALEPADAVSAWMARFRYCVFGRPLRATLYPPRAVLFRKDRCHYVQDGHTMRLQISGQTSWLGSVIDHDDRKSLPQWLLAQDRYANLEVEKLLRAAPGSLGLQDRLRRKVVFAPVLVFLYTLIGKGLILDGWPGWYYVFERTLSETVLSLRLIEARVKSRK